MKKLNLLITLLIFTAAIETCDKKRVHFTENESTKHYYFDPSQETDDTFKFYSKDYMLSYQTHIASICANEDTNRRKSNAECKSLIYSEDIYNHQDRLKLHVQMILSQANRTIYPVMQGALLDQIKSLHPHQLKSAYTKTEIDYLRKRDTSLTQASTSNENIIQKLTDEIILLEDHIQQLTKRGCWPFKN